jgi:hypothetical protein
LKRCSLDEEFSDRPGCVYVIKLTNDLESFIKVGVSCRRDKRFNLYKSAGFDVDTVSIAEMSNYNSALLERKLLTSIKSSGYRYNPITDFIGYTECSTLAGEDHILGIIKEFNIEQERTNCCRPEQSQAGSISSSRL